MKIAILDTVHAHHKIEREAISAEGWDMQLCRSENIEEQVDAAKDAQAILVNLATIDGAFMDRCPELKVIARYGIGFDNVDAEAASERGIWLSNCQDYCQDEVAEHSLALMLSCARSLHEREEAVRVNDWAGGSRLPVKALKGAVLGIVGYGASGRALALKALSLGFESILVHTRTTPTADVLSPAEKSIVFCDLDRLFESSDFISLHIPLNEETRYFLSQTQFEKMKDDAVLINTSRGAVINESHLSDALKLGKFFAVGLDVFEQEPLAHNSELLAFKRVRLSPHSAWYSPQSLNTLKSCAVENAIRVLKGSRPVYPVNEPKKSKR